MTMTRVQGLTLTSVAAMRDAIMAGRLVPIRHRL